MRMPLDQFGRINPLTPETISPPSPVARPQKANRKRHRHVPVEPGAHPNSPSAVDRLPSNSVADNRTQRRTGSGQ
jgi:hypothetical protein